MSNESGREISDTARTEGFWLGVIVSSLLWWVFG